MPPTRMRRNQPARRRSRSSKGYWRAAAWLFLAGAVLLVAAGGIVVGAALGVARQIQDVSRLYVPPSQTTRIFAHDGELIASLYRENRQIVPLAEIPLILQRAVIAMEDERFYSHRGVDFRGIARAMWRNLRKGELLEGGSTITQQVARMLFLSQERVISRKAAEMVLAIEIERRLTKDEILERYLNQVYFGQGAHGVEMASRVYFGKPVREVTLPEAAMLAGLIRAPSVYSAPQNSALAKRQQGVVLARMEAVGYLSRESAAAARSAPVRLAPSSNAGLVGIRAPYFVSFILSRLLETYGEDLVYKGGLQVHTTLDLKAQAAAEKAVRSGLEGAKRRRLNVGQGALVAVDTHSGAIRAMIGGADFAQSQFNRAWQARRQPGSAFKVFVYTAATNSGIPPTRLLENAPITYKIVGAADWSPKNYDGKYSEPVTLRRALERSINIPAAKMVHELGPERVIEVARAMGIESPLQPHLSLALGSWDVTPLEMASAFASLANGGVRLQPLAITKVTDPRGKVLEEHRPKRQAALPAEVAFVVTDLLKGVIDRGTGTAANIGRPAAGKTGTTDDYRNAWFVGYTPFLSAAVWVGNDDNTPMNRVVGGGVPAEMWAAFMKAASSRYPPDDWATPEGVVVTTVCAGSWQLATQGCLHPRREVFTRASAPTRYDLAPGRTDAGGAQSSVRGQGAIFVSVSSPADGSILEPPFVIDGVTSPGAMVSISVVAEGPGGASTAAEVSMQADPSGRFAFEFRPATRWHGMRYLITVVAQGAGGAKVSRSLTVVDGPPEAPGR